MNTVKTYRIISNVVLLIAVLLISDTFLLPKKQMVEVKADGYTKRTRTRKSRYTSYFIISESNHTYNVTEDIWAGVTIGNSFTIYRSFIFHKPVQLSWCEEESCYIQNIGIMNKTTFSYIILCFLVVWPILHLMNIVHITSKKFDIANYLAPTLAVLTFLFHLLH